MRHWRRMRCIIEMRKLKCLRLNTVLWNSIFPESALAPVDRERRLVLISPQILFRHLSTHLSTTLHSTIQFNLLQLSNTYRIWSVSNWLSAPSPSLSLLLSTKYPRCRWSISRGTTSRSQFDHSSHITLTTVWQRRFSYEWWLIQLNVLSIDLSASFFS